MPLSCPVRKIERTRLNNSTTSNYNQLHPINSGKTPFELRSIAEELRGSGLSKTHADKTETSKISLEISDLSNFQIFNMSLTSVKMSEDVWLTCLTHALSTETEEIMGLLLGDIEVYLFIFLNSFWVINFNLCSYFNEFGDFAL